MPERTAKSAERCDVHAGRASVASCDGCGLPMCLTCAVPVRGRVLCPTCLAEEIGPEELPDTVRRGGGAAGLVGAAMAVALASTAFPWTRFGVGSGAFGAWGWSFRWSLVPAAASLIGLAAWIWFRAAPVRASREALALGALAAAVGLGALVAIMRPPPFAHASVAPWVAVAAGTAGLLGSIALARNPPRS